MINYRLEVYEDVENKWVVKIYANSDLLCAYLRIDSQDDAYLVGEAFIDGIKYVRGES